MEIEKLSDKGDLLTSKQYLAQAIGRQVYFARRSRGVTGSELAEKLGISQQQVSRYERGICRIDVDTLVYLLNQLNIPLDAFFYNVSLTLKELSPKTYEQYYSCFYQVIDMINDKHTLIKNNRYF
ncbi:helix-turn-helix domain-containing protein (plasmid) [Providencia rettgeri]|uniref:helix-turn-helix domain-containing protein n=1 Tax=Providencia rettgeri TaxID=587 RepID=UPI001CA6AFAC|nr:helix-turn-helix domain-containing protein [Providencia rettgeri]